MQPLFAGVAKQVIVDLEPMTEEELLLDGLKKEKMVKSNVEAKKEGIKGVIEEVGRRGQKEMRRVRPPLCSMMPLTEITASYY